MFFFFINSLCVWRRGGLIVSALESGSSGPGSNPGWGHCVVFLGKTLYSHSASQYVQMGTGEFNAGGDLRWTGIPSRECKSIPGCFMLKIPGYAQASMMGYLARMQTLLTYLPTLYLHIYSFYKVLTCSQGQS